MADAERIVPIVLVGFRGSGKSTLGRRLSADLKRPFFDLDGEIEQAQGSSIPRIFEERGEACFREIEREMLAGILARPGIVLAPGGGAVLLQDNRRCMREKGFVIYLRVTKDDLLERLQGSQRPRLTNRPWSEEVELLLQEREPLYQEVAHRVLEVPSREPPERTYLRLRELAPTD